MEKEITILMWKEESKTGKLHYHMNTHGLSQEQLYDKIFKKLEITLPEGFRIRRYAPEDYGVIDSSGRRYIHFYLGRFGRQKTRWIHVSFPNNNGKTLFLETIRNTFPDCKIVEEYWSC